MSTQTDKDPIFEDTLKAIEEVSLVSGKEKRVSLTNSAMPTGSESISSFSPGRDKEKINNLSRALPLPPPNPAAIRPLHSRRIP